MNIIFYSYFIIYSVILATVISDDRAKVPQILGLFVPFIYLVLVGTRNPLLVPDTESYIYLFSTLDISNVFDPFYYYVSSIGPGFIVLSKVIKLFAGSSSVIFLTTLAAISIIMVSIFGNRIAHKASEFSLCLMTKNELRKMEYWDSILIMILYISYFGFLYNAIVLRQGIALTLIVLGTYFLLAGRFALPVILLLISIQMHQSAYFGIIIYLIILSKMNFNIRTYRFIYAVSIVIYLTGFGKYIAPELIGWIQQQGMFIFYDSHIDNALFSGVVSLRGLFFYLLGFIFLLKKKNNQNFYYYLNIYIVGLLFYAFFASMDWISRVTDYFLIFSFVLVYFELKELRARFWRILLMNFVIICQSVLVYRILMRIGV